MKYIIIYGAGEVGKDTLLHMQQAQLPVIIILDRKMNGMVSGIPILHPDRIKISTRIKKESAVVICLSDGMLHKEVAEQLEQLGFEKIVFLPMGYRLERKEKMRLISLYNQALQGKDIYEDVKEYRYYKKKISESAKIREENSRVVVWVGQEILFSENKTDWKGDRSKIHMVNNGIQVNLNAYYWYHELFRYLKGTVENCKDYLSIFYLQEETDAANEKILAREKLYRELKHEISYGMDFFIEAAPNVIWNQNGYFNIVGGNHRTIFLQSEGYINYPVRMSREDYEIWMNHKKLEKFKQWIRKNHIDYTYVPIPHPYFMSVPYLREGYGKTILSALYRYWGPISLANRNIIDLSEYQGYFTRIASRMGAREVIFSSKDENELEFAQNIFELLQLRNIKLQREIDKLSIDKANIVFAMKRARRLLKENNLKDFEGMLFVEFNVKDVDFMKEVMADTRMKCYRSLHREVFNGEMLEFGVFSCS